RTGDRSIEEFLTALERHGQTPRRHPTTSCTGTSDPYPDGTDPGTCVTRGDADPLSAFQQMIALAAAAAPRSRCTHRRPLDRGVPDRTGTARPDAAPAPHHIVHGDL
ncbi:hypothetical protein CTI14_57800, partial [Methylobacterium radiotolerans]